MSKRPTLKEGKDDWGSKIEERQFLQGRKAALSKFRNVADSSKATFKGPWYRVRIDIIEPFPGLHQMWGIVSRCLERAMELPECCLVILSLLKFPLPNVNFER